MELVVCRTDWAALAAQTKAEVESLQPIVKRLRREAAVAKKRGCKLDVVCSYRIVAEMYGEQRSNLQMFLRRAERDDMEP